MRRRRFLAVLAAGPAAAPTLAAGSAMVYIGAFQNTILVLDEAQEKVVDRITLHTGVPRGLRLSYDKKKIYVFSAKSGIEVVDLATRKVTNHFELDEGNRRVRTHGSRAPDPKDQLLYSIVSVAVRQADRFEIEKPKFAVIDLTEKKITRTADLPKEEEERLGRGADLRVSPDGRYLYAFQDNVLIFETSDFKLVEKIELSKPLYPGMATIGLGLRDDPYEDRGVVTGVFNSTDPIVRRSIFGIARFDLNKRTFDFTPVGPAATAGMMGLQVTPDGKTGYTVAFQGELGNRRTEFWVFDMGTRKVATRVEFDGPINFGFRLSGNGKQIYIHGTAPAMEIYDAGTLKRKKVLDFNVDMTTAPLVVPSGIS